MESFTVSHPLTEYHYTLYYYDQAGNLVKTIPPEGVHHIRRDTWLDSVKLSRNEEDVLRPLHTLATTYRYNSLNQVIDQHSPDGGLSHFWYDRLGRLTISQNAKQLLEGNYSYTLYDVLGRITEVGQKKQVTAMSDAIARNRESLNTWLSYTYTLEGTTVIAEQVTKTIYDLKDPQSGSLTPGYLMNSSFQKAYTLRNRVSYTRFYQKLRWNGMALLVDEFDNSSTYSYDIHGNVDTLLHNYLTGLMVQDHGNNQFKTIAYKYDLISGKVNEVHYQPGMADQLYHRYEYDAENRLTDAYTTDRKQLLGIPVLEEHEARYSYYKHGPLARTVIGQQQVQGVDYAYTLQGWLKGVNSDSLLDEDGSIVARDAYRFSLNYFNGDYQPIGIAAASAFPGHSAFMDVNDHKPLYNGNISSMVVGIPKLGETKLYNYGYDQLNRIVRMDAFNGYDLQNLDWIGLHKTDEYKERISYDGNGNILRYKRNGHAGQLGMDSLTYHYNRDDDGYLSNNRLRHVKDSVGDGNYAEDIDRQLDDNNYEYDSIGNLVKDVKEGIDTIIWTVYGKIKSIEKTDGTTIGYTYDVAGNRISKTVTKDEVATTTWYVRDAQGNTMAIYTNSGGGLTLSEHHLYGSSRLGVWNRNIDMDAVPNPNNYTFTRGNKFFELSNHLGNVLVTVSDIKIGVDPGTDGTSDYYTADVVTANDYYPFGMLMPGRNYSAGNSYRYGFNGKEKDNDVNGDGNQYDYGFRIYNPRIGRFLSVDPLTQSYPWYTPYQFAGNSPIWAIDLDGLEDYVVVKELYKNGATKKVSIQYTVKKDEPKSTINMQFKQLLGKNTDGTDKLGGSLTDQKVVRVIRDVNKKEKVEYADDLNKEEKAIKNQFTRNELSNPTNDAWKLTINSEKYTSGTDRDETVQQDKIAQKSFHLIKNLNSSLNKASFFIVNPASGEGTLMPKDAIKGMDKSEKEFYDLPSTIKEDGGIKSISITLTYYVSSNVTDADFSGLQKAFVQVADQVKDMYLKSGVKNLTVNPVIERRSDYKEANENTPAVQINLKR